MGKRENIKQNLNIKKEAVAVLWKNNLGKEILYMVPFYTWNHCYKGSKNKL